MYFCDKKKTMEILKLAEEVRELAESAENKDILNRWQVGCNDVSVTEGASVWHGIPEIKMTKLGAVPFTVDPETVFYASALHFDLREYYLNPYAYLENALKIKLFRFKEFGDDSYITKNVSLFLGVVLEPSMFGIESVYPADRDPWNGHNYVVSCSGDLENIPEIDFYSSGIMPRCIEFYEIISKILPDDFSVSFPIWGRGPWGVAQHLMGFDNLFLSIYDDPEFLHNLLGNIVRRQCNWLSQRADYLKTALSVGVMYNDEVNCQLIPPEIYKNFIFPYEKKVAEFQNGISYWHSCGNTAPILKDVKKLPGLKMYDVSAWTDWQVAASELKDMNIAAEIRLHPIEHILMADEKHMRDTISEFRNVFEGMKVTLRADGMQPVGSIEENLNKIRTFATIAKEMLR